ncbi:MAG: hypothetical protein HYY93_14435 [Planctomycetes bacterium]|nr:hypothetical protein [Planctomycetota bacterium]
MAEDKIIVQCPKCGERMKFSDLFIGRPGVCTACGEVFVIMPPDPAPAGQGRMGPPPSTRHRANRFHISTYFKKKEPGTRP